MSTAPTAKSPITCHVLDTSKGKPATGVQIRLQEYISPGREGVDLLCAEGQTDADGRCMALLPQSYSIESPEKRTYLRTGLYKIEFKTKEYFESFGERCFYPWVDVIFEVVNPDEHYHIPLLISPFSYTTYRGS